MNDIYSTNSWNIIPKWIDWSARNAYTMLSNGGCLPDMVARKLPPGKVLLARFGIDDNAERLEVGVRRIKNCPAEIFIVPALDVGLERQRNGVRLNWCTDASLAGKFCVLTNDGT